MVIFNQENKFSNQQNNDGSYEVSLLALLRECGTSIFKQLFIAALFIILAGFSSCKDCGGESASIWGNDPTNAEKIYTPSVKEENDWFEVTEVKDADGSRCVNTVHKTFASTEHYCLYSPNGNLKLVAAGASESCALYAAIIDYDSLGQVCNVKYADLLDDEEHRKLGSSGTDSTSVQVMKHWLATASIIYETPIKRDSDNNVISVGAVEVPDGYRAKYYLEEWGPFWTSDLSGGDISFFVLLEKAENTDGSYVNYLYCGNNLIAELAYWKGVFIKARTYNSNGVMVRQYNDRNIDLNSITYYDYDEEPKWYVE